MNRSRLTFPILKLALLVSLSLTGCAPSTAAEVALPAVTPPATVPATATATQPAATASPTATPTVSPTLTPVATTTALPTSTATPETTATGSSCDIENVVIISIDGLRPDALDQTDTPVFDTLKARGSFHPAAQAVLPSVTLVNHASMLGGMSPEKHGIYWNSGDSGLGKINGPTLFSVAHEAGLSTAMVVGKPKLEDLVLPDSVDQYLYAGFTDRQVTNRALALIEEGLPNVLFIHLPDVDSAGHATGWMSLGQLLALSWTDGNVGEIVAALEAGQFMDHTLLIITADHGGSGKAHGSDSPEDVTIPWLAIGPGVPIGGTLQQPIIAYDTAATALYALKLPLPDSWEGQPVQEIFDQAECIP